MVKLPFLVVHGALVWKELDMFAGSAVPLRRAVMAAIAGNGGPLAEELRTGDLLLWSEMPWLLPVLDRVTRNRGELAAAVRHYRSGSSSYMSPFAELQDLAVYRDMSAVLGDTAAAARWQGIIERVASVLSDRRRALGFAILEKI